MALLNTHPSDNSVFVFRHSRLERPPAGGDSPGSSSAYAGAAHEIEAHEPSSQVSGKTAHEVKTHQPSSQVTNRTAHEVEAHEPPSQENNRTPVTS